VLTVLIATYNGAATLPLTFEALARLAPPSGSWKLVVVDNCSTDDTAAIIRSHASRLPLTYVHEPRRGQNAARNAGLHHMEGDLLVCTDDDVVPESDWLCALRKSADTHPECAMFTGRIVPRWSTPPPEWIRRWVNMEVCFAATDPAQREGPVRANAVWSPNMALRRAIFDAGFTFDEHVGPDGSAAYAMGSETDFTTRAEDHGFRAWFCERAVVHHLVRDFQLDRDWILGRAVRYGRGMCRRHLRCHPEGTTTLLWGYPVDTLAKIARHAIRARLFKLLSEERWFREQWEQNYLIGWAREAKRYYAEAL